MLYYSIVTEAEYTERSFLTGGRYYLSNDIIALTRKLAGWK